MKNVTFHLKNEEVLNFLDKYKHNKSEFAEKALYDAMTELRKREFVKSILQRQKQSAKMKLGSSEDTVRFTRKLRLSR